MEPTQFKLALLQAYPLGTLEVKTPDGVGFLNGLRLTKHTPTGKLSKDCRTVAAVVIDNHDFNNYFDLEDVTPRLRPLRSLTTKLADGTIAAVEVAKLAHGLDPGKEFKPTFSHTADGLVVRLQDEKRNEWSTLIDKDNLNIVLLMVDRFFLTRNTLAILDYLRRNLFALPIGGQPLQEGTDYIAKED